MKVNVNNVGEALADVVEQLVDSGEVDAKCAIRDVLTEVIHLCRKNGLDPEERFYAAINTADGEENDDGP